MLRQHGPLPLRSLHTWLHHYGYVIPHAHPVKALADAMGWEVEQGRVERVARGTYAIARNETTTRWFRGLEPPLVDPWLDHDQPSRAGHPGFLAPREPIGDPFAPLDAERARRATTPGQRSGTDHPS
ncbi:hypothetical protein KSP35_18950 [Aquihabitans sp. G128]|uniref:hypothetical protein n=1 Tax=Aquihabitans sp. G128 TaxID=2849779 RepID=UPI001C230DC7|nr:hypothetical protein [Aquihabitans sp. G128]QXC60384.1 hypothetical protein KSP35_18950 [Aquihabitans sp. G128]